MKRFFIAAVALFASIASFGQDQKLGYADTDYILSQLPEAKKVDQDLKTHGAQLEAQMKTKADEYQRKQAELEKNQNTWVDAVVQDKIRELQMLQQQFGKFQQDAEASFNKKQQDLMGPLYDKVGKAIAEVSKENGYAFIITLNAGGGAGNVLLYKDAQFDVSNLVLKKMGVTPAPAPTTNPKPKTN